MKSIYGDSKKITTSRNQFTKTIILRQWSPKNGLFSGVHLKTTTSLNRCLEADSYKAHLYNSLSPTCNMFPLYWAYIYIALGFQSYSSKSKSLIVGASHICLSMHDMAPSPPCPLSPFARGGSHHGASRWRPTHLASGGSKRP